MSQSNNKKTIKVKWGHFGLWRCIQISGPKYYDSLMKKIESIEPNFTYYLCYEDEANKPVIFSSEHELLNRINEVFDKDLKTPTQLVIKTIEVVDRQFDNSKSKHQNIYCDYCNSPVEGIRYKCIECEDFNLCTFCGRFGIHPNHLMLRFVRPESEMSSNLYKLVHAFRMQNPIDCDSQEEVSPKVCQKLLKVKKVKKTSHKKNLCKTKTSSKKFNKSLKNDSDNDKTDSTKQINDRFSLIKKFSITMQQALLNYGLENISKSDTTNPFPTLLINNENNYSSLNSNPTKPFETPSNSKLATKRKRDERVLFEKRINSPKGKLFKINKNTFQSPQNHSNENKASSLQSEKDEKSNLLSVLNLAQTAGELASETYSMASGIAKNIINSFEQNKNENSFNKIGLNVFSDVKTGIENLTNNVNPLIAELIEKCRVISETEVDKKNNTDESTENSLNSKESVNLNNAETNLNEFVEETPNTSDESNKKFSDTSSKSSDSFSIKTFNNVRSSISSSERINVSQNSQESDHSEIDKNHSNPCFDKYKPYTSNWFIPYTFKNLCNVYEKKRALTLDDDELNREIFNESFNDENDTDESSRLPSINEKEYNDDDISLTSSLYINPTTDLSYTDIMIQKRICEKERNKKKDELCPTTSTPIKNDNNLNTFFNKNSNKFDPNLTFDNSEGQLIEKSINDQECYAGMPFYQIKKPHSKVCHIRHSNPKVQSSVDLLNEMGYDNCNGWLTALSLKFNGELEDILDEIPNDLFYKARMEA